MRHHNCLTNLMCAASLLCVSSIAWATPNPPIVQCSVSECTEPLLTGVFIDAPVEGLNYFTETLSGVTNDIGGFSFAEGETVHFGFGNVELGEAAGQSVLTPLDIIPNDPDLQAKLMSFLQSLDEDQNLANGILLNNTVETLLRNYVSEQPQDNTFASLVDRSDYGALVARLSAHTQWIESSVALAHFNVEIAPLVDSGQYVIPPSSPNPPTGNCTTPTIPPRNEAWQCAGFPGLATTVYIRPGVTLLHMGSP